MVPAMTSVLALWRFKMRVSTKWGTSILMSTKM